MWDLWGSANGGKFSLSPPPLTRNKGLEAESLKWEVIFLFWRSWD